MAPQDLNEGALYRLLEDPNGPLGQFMESVARDLVESSKGHAFKIIERIPDAASYVEQIDQERQGDGSIMVGIRGSDTTEKGKKSASKYLAEKEAKPHEKGWMKPALAERFPGSG